MTEVFEAGAPRSAIARLIAEWHSVADKWDELAITCVFPEDGKHFKIAANEKRLCADELDAALRAGVEAPREGQSSDTSAGRAAALASGATTEADLPTAPAPFVGNWHEIDGPNGMCKCGTEHGGCPERLQRHLQRAVDYWEAIAKFLQRERERAIDELPEAFARSRGSLAEKVRTYREFVNRAAAAPPRPPAQKSGSEAAYQQPVDDMVTKMAEKLTDESPRYSLVDRIAQWREQAAQCRAEIEAGRGVSPYPLEGAMYLQGREFAFDRCADEAEIYLRAAALDADKEGSSLSLAETQKLLGSDRPISIGKVPTDPIGMRAMASIVGERTATPPNCGLSANDIYHVMQAWEQMPASEEQTRIVIGLGKLREQCIARGDSHFVTDLLAPPRPPAPPTQNHKLDTDARVFFYEQDFYVLSNFSAFTLQWKGLSFDTSEAAYHWEKFAGVYPSIADRIRFAPSAHAAFKIAEAAKAECRSDWDAVKVGIMREILRAKAAQHEYVRRKLLATGDRELIEDSWRDGFWGWGEHRDGLNMLGKLWMEIRAELPPARPDAPEAPKR